MMLFEAVRLVFIPIYLPEIICQITIEASNVYYGIIHKNIHSIIFRTHRDRRYEEIIINSVQN